MAKTSITSGQIKKIHTLKNRLGIDDATYREILVTSFRVDSSTKLDVTQADSLIHDLEGKAVAAGTWEKRKPPEKKFSDMSRRVGMASAPQLRKIEAMWQGISRAQSLETRQKALRSFVERIAKVSDLRFLDQEGATKVINALNKMSKSKNKSRN